MPRQFKWNIANVSFASKSFPLGHQISYLVLPHCLFLGVVAAYFEGIHSLIDLRQYGTLL